MSGSGKVVGGSLSGDDLWAAVAAPGTSPGLLARVVVRLRDDGGATTRLARDLAEAAQRTPGVAPADLLTRLLARAADPLPGLAGVQERGPGPGAPPSSPPPEALARRWRDSGVVAALVGDPGYPGRLGAAWPDLDLPPLLAWRGAMRHVERAPAVAIVGARRATPYGTGIAAWLADAASAAGVTVVSGGAVGIDAAAHEAALGGPGRTVVVLGCGHAVDYPRPHARPDGLFDRVVASGGALVSEHLPVTPPRPAVVRARNRIVAALADAVVVVEGGPRSGALLTATAAAERGSAVLAVPGDVRRPGSAAPHRLLAEGAAPCTGPDDLLAALGAMPAAGTTPQHAAPSTLPDALRAPLAEAWPQPLRMDELAAAAALPVGQVLAAVTRAQIAGEVAESSQGVRFVRAPRTPRPALSPRPSR